MARFREVRQDREWVQLLNQGTRFFSDLLVSPGERRGWKPLVLASVFLVLALIAGVFAWREHRYAQETRKEKKKKGVKNARPSEPHAGRKRARR